MFNKILIANRGEIAVRIIRACKELGIKTVAVYSMVDKESLHVKIADEAVCIGKDRSPKSYLNIQNILEAACLTGTEAIHPGYGFLSENYKFAKMCEECNIKFIGPNYKIIELMGNKINSKNLMVSAGVPVIEGTNESIETLKQLRDRADKIGFPVILKAAAGGGGKGIRIVKAANELVNAFEMVKTEAMQAFKDSEIYMEKYIENPRHIEVQVLADEHGNAIYLGERDCSVQRKNQKMIEEAPANSISKKLRIKMGKAALDAVKASKYVNAGTIEFLVDKNEDFYFMEMNTRLQVEHPVTELVTDIDIVKEQIRIADGEKLSVSQSDIELKGYSIEARINAENPDKNFMACPGKIDFVRFPAGNGIRVDSHIYSGYEILPYYDSMIGKIIVYAKTRDEAILKMKVALNELEIKPITTNKEFLLKILDNEKYKSGEFDTSLLSEYFI